MDGASSSSPSPPKLWSENGEPQFTCEGRAGGLDPEMSPQLVREAYARSHFAALMRSRPWATGVKKMREAVLGLLMFGLLGAGFWYSSPLP